MEQLTMAVYVIWKEGVEHHEPPADISVVIEGVKVLNELPSFTSAFALLLRMIYINLAYPKTLRFTFEVFQKVLLQLDQHKMSSKVQNYPFVQSYV
uniref:Uncharacterized protein n=1 Tax=Cyprinus carpio TaxID=7962 RepID=A0A8C1N7J3_CYPCA